MTKTLKKTAPFIATVILIALIGIIFSQEKARAANTNDYPATVATTTSITVSTTPGLAFATSTCASRVVSTGASGIMIGFGERTGFTPSGTQGFWQGASTTVAYDASQYGCGAVRIYSGTTQNITVMESR